jgi:hypothetical protein
MFGINDLFVAPMILEVATPKQGQDTFYADNEMDFKLNE